MDPSIESVETASVHIAQAKYQATITSGNHTLIADEPEDIGGADTGPNPFSLLLASLGSCTAITLRMYIDRKLWAVDEITVSLELFRPENHTLIERRISFKGDLTPEQTKRLMQIADACPIHKILVGNIVVQSTLV